MKKKISLVIGLSALAIVCITGCGKREALEYDRGYIEQVTEAMISNCTGLDDEAAGQLETLRESVFEQRLAEMGMPVAPESFLGALEAWEAGEEECGAYIGHGAFTFEAGEDELKVEADAEFEDRDAVLEFVYDDQLFLESVTVSAEYTMGEIVQKAALNTVLGMGTVFAVLILISGIISLLKYIPALQERFRKKRVKEAVIPEEETEKTPAAEETSPSAEEDPELAAVIAAAIAAAEGTSSDGFVVRSIRRRRSNKWN